ncbi:g1852 [Coccomyxa elongata]
MLSQGGLAGVASYPPQYYFQQLQRPIQPHPPAQGLVSSSQGRVVEKRKRHWTKKRKQQPGSQPHHPSQLSALASKNRQRTKRHYPQGQETPARTPRTVPRAPFNSSADLMRRQQVDGVNLASSSGAVGHGDENLDFYGTNDTLLMQEASASDDASESGDSESEAAYAGAEDQPHAALRPREDQTAYIMTLEQENMHLRQENLDLQEKIFILQEQLRNGGRPPIMGMDMTIWSAVISWPSKLHDCGCGAAARALLRQLSEGR